MGKRVRKKLFFFTFLCGSCCNERKRSDSTSLPKMRQASLFHALIIIFLEYFSWGLLTVPVINVSFLLSNKIICF